VVIDFKGENAKITAPARDRLGHKVVILDPFKHITQAPDTYNPLDFISKESPNALDECRDLASALVIQTGEEKEPHWTESAKAWIAAMVAVVVFHCPKETRSLQMVRTLLSDPERMQDAIKLMCSSDAAGGMLSRMGHQLKHYVDKELASTLTTTLRFLYFLDTPAVFDSTRSSSFDPSELVTGRMTLYLVLPPEHMRAQAGLLRMWIGSMLRAVVRNGLQEQKKVHFILDEAASLGHLEPLDDAVDKYRGYGVRLLFLFQSLGQLSKCFPGQEQTLLSNTSSVFFGVNDKDTAEYASARLGDETIIVDSGGKNEGVSMATSQGSTSVTRSWGRNDNWSQIGRRLLKPEEVMALHPRVAITFTPGVPPILTALTRYYEPNQRRGRFSRLRVAVWAVIFLALSVLAVRVVTDFSNRRVSYGEGQQYGVPGSGQGGGEGVRDGDVSGGQPEGRPVRHVGRDEAPRRPGPGRAGPGPVQ
jgi:type IV secretion system protein VirD4